MKTVRTTEAIGHVLCHDVTQIIKDVTKDAVFRKGHVVKEEDVPVLLSIGKETLYVWEAGENMLHENDAVYILRDICKNENMSATEPKEGKIDLSAEIDGLFAIDRERLFNINSFGDVMIASRSDMSPVKKGDKLLGTRVIPLVIEKNKMEKIKSLYGGTPIASLFPYQKKRVGIVTTGSEVYHKRIKDTFTPVVVDKLSEYGAEILGNIVVDDNPKKITEAIMELLARGAQMVACTGGMSVDPDDKTPAAIRNTGADIISYGAPTLPGAMFMLAYYNGNIPIFGLPGCVMYAKRTIFDIVLPRLMADVRVTKESLAALGNGGLCLSCDICIFPNCGFGK